MVKPSKAFGRRDVAIQILPQLNLCCVAEASPIEARGHENRSRIKACEERKVLDMEEVDALPEDLRLVVLLDAERASAGMAPPEALFQYGQTRVVGHQLGTSST